MVSSSTSVSVLAHHTIVSESVIILVSRVDQNGIHSLDSGYDTIKNRQASSFSYLEWGISISSIFHRNLIRRKELLVRRIRENSGTVVRMINLNRWEFMIVICVLVVLSELSGREIRYIVYNFAIFSLHNYNTLCKFINYNPIKCLGSNQTALFLSFYSLKPKILNRLKRIRNSKHLY